VEHVISFKVLQKVQERVADYWTYPQQVELPHHAEVNPASLHQHIIFDKNLADSFNSRSYVAVLEPNVLSMRLKHTKTNERESTFG
jgi:hypothetical protein